VGKQWKKGEGGAVVVGWRRISGKLFLFLGGEWIVAACCKTNV